MTWVLLGALVVPMLWAGIYVTVVLQDRRMTRRFQAENDGRVDYAKIHRLERELSGERFSFNPKHPGAEAPPPARNRRAVRQTTHTPH